MPKQKRAKPLKPRPPIAGPLLRTREAMEFVGLRTTQFHKAVRAGELPRPIKLTNRGRAVGFLKSELEAWLAARVAARDSA
jgi:predicted DNA-binding transcriptional regulator AlpA